MKSTHIAMSVPGPVLHTAYEASLCHGPLTAALLRRAVRDSGILRDLERLPGQYGIVGATWGCSARTAREVEAAARSLRTGDVV